MKLLICCLKNNVFENGITPENARNIVDKFQSQTKLKFNEEEVENFVKLLPDRFNELFGLNRKTPDLNMSLKKSSSWREVFPNAKVYKLADAKSVQELGDKTIAPSFCRVEA